MPGQEGSCLSREKCLSLLAEVLKRCGSYSGGGGVGGGITSTHNKRGCAILTRKVVPKNPGTYLKLRPKNPGTRNARLSF